MVAAVDSGWGSGEWGDAPWGSADPDLVLLSALAVAENRIRLMFSDVPVFNGLMTSTDASDPSHYSVVPVPGGIGLDGEPVRSVLPVLVEVSPVAGSGGTELDVTLDRPMTGWPAQYQISAVGLVSTSGAFLAPGSSVIFDGARAGKPPPVQDSAIAAVDFANPQVPQDLAGLAVGDRPSLVFGTFPVDATGDYATASPLASYRGRCVRRILTAVDGFAHLLGYGSGVPSAVKKPGRLAFAVRVANVAAQQIRLEPETVSISISPTLTEDGVILFKVRALAKFGRADFDVPVAA
jgi:hypothetical protein